MLCAWVLLRDSWEQRYFNSILADLLQLRAARPGMMMMMMKITMINIKRHIH